MKQITLFLIIIHISILQIISQVAINNDSSNPQNSAMLDVKSTEKGFLPPRMTGAERDAINDPSAGLMIWCLNCGPWGEVQVYNGQNWVNMLGGTVSPAFVCGSSMLSDDEGNTYNTVQIGTQCWMAQNLNIGEPINSSVGQSNNVQIEKYCYDDMTNNCSDYGGLYQWDEMMIYATSEGAKGVCPIGWHIPTDDEFKTLEIYLGMTQIEADAFGWRGVDEGEQMKNISGWYMDGNGTNLSAFTAIPTGHNYGAYQFIGEFTQSDFWTSSTWIGSQVFHRMQYDYDQVYRGVFTPEKALAVRCIKDQ